MSAPAPIPSFEALCGDLDTALLDPEMLDEGDKAPSEHALSTAKRLIEETQVLLPDPITHPHIEFFESAIRLSWRNAHKMVLLVIASDKDRSYLYHANIENDLVGDHGTLEPTAPNLAYWLGQI